MNTRLENQESTIPKEIRESILSLSKTPLNFFKIPSAPNISSKNMCLEIIGEEKSYQEKEDSESNREYKIGNYMVKYTLGQGTFGKVKLGVYIPNNEKVAIKILEKDRIIEKDDEIRVKREFDMLAQFSHPNVILVAEIFESEDSYYSVMEFCEGGELFNYIVKKNRLSEEESSFFFFQLINGLEYIHSLGIVHRDLKPENLLLTGEHILKIIDFGLSNYFQTGQSELLSTPCGSPCYASPEMVAGKKYDGFKIDVWSCGIILYAMLCGYLPFEDPDNEVLFKKILECKLEFPDYVNKLSIDLIEKILVTDPEKRITIKEIKKHPFYLKGKEIFEEGFSINQIVQNPIEKNMGNKNDDKENIDINNEEKVIEINIEEKQRNKDRSENKNKDKENFADIGYKENKKNIEKNKKDKNDKIKEEKRAEENKENVNAELDANIRKEKNKRKNKKKSKQNNNNKALNKHNENALVKKDKDKEKNVKDGEENEKKQNKLNIEINLDNNLNTNEGEKSNYNKNLLPTEQEEIYMPLKTEYNNANNMNFKFNTLDNMKENKQNKNNSKEKDKKSSEKIKENNLKKYFELKPNEKLIEKEKSISKSKEKQKEKSISKSKEKPKDNNKKFITELINITTKLATPTINKEDENNNTKKKKDLTPKKIFISKNVKSQRPSNIQNLSKKINIKISTKKKFLQQKHRQEKLVSAKEPKRIKSTFEYKNLNLNVNKYTKNTRSQIKGILNTFNLNKKTNNDRLNTENVHIKNKNLLDKNNYINRTIDTIKNNLLFNISDIKNDIIKNRMKKPELKTKLFHDLDDKIKLSDIKRLKSNTFNDENTNIFNINNNTLPLHTQTPLSKHIPIIKPKSNNLLYNINNLTSLKVPYELNLTDSNQTSNLLNNNTTNLIKTEPSSDLFFKLSNLPKKTPLYSNHTNYIKKTKTNTATLGLNNRSINSRRTNLQYRPYLKYINTIRKAPTYNILKTMNLKNIPKTTSDILANNKKIISKEKKNPLILAQNNKKNQQVTIRNTVINFNMIDTEIILPSVKKIKSGKKFNSTYNTNTVMGMGPNKKNSRELTNELRNFNTLNNIDTFNNLNSINTENKYNNTINRFSNLNSYMAKENKFSNNIHEYNNMNHNMNHSNKKINSISSFNKLVNNMKIKQKYNKLKFNNYNISSSNANNIKALNDKIHNKFKSMKFNDYFKTNKTLRKSIEISGINNFNNNLSTNSVNNTIVSTSNRLKSLNNEQNLTLPSLLNKNKKFIIPKGKGYVITSQGKAGKLLATYKTPSVFSENIK